MSKFQIGDKIQCTDTRRAEHLQWNKIYTVVWCSELYVRINQYDYCKPCMYSVDRFEEIFDAVRKK